MAEQPLSFPFDDVPLDEARRMGRRRGIDPALYRALQQKIPSLDNTAARMTLPEGTSPTTVKNRISRVATTVSMPVTIRRVPKGLLFWRSTDEDIQQATHVAPRMQTARRQGRARPGQGRHGSRRMTFPDDPSSCLHKEGRP